MELIEKKEFVIVAFDPEYEPLVVHVAAFSVNLDDKMHHSRKAQLAYIKVDKVSTNVPSKYADFANVFSPKLVAKTSKAYRNQRSCYQVSR